MAQYLLRRTLQSIFTLFVISLLIFILVNSVPGGMMSAYEENADFSPEDIARLRQKFGL
ncbi:MAG: diguanylate cyclase, partial [Chloroflexota bacterium]